MFFKSHCDKKNFFFSNKTKPSHLAKRKPQLKIGTIYFREVQLVSENDELKILEN